MSAEGDDLQGYTDAEVWDRIALYRNRAGSPAGIENPKLNEFEILASGRATIGTNAPTARLYADWPPAIEQFGEGIFLHFDSGPIEAWKQNEAVTRRLDVLIQGWQAHRRKLPVTAENKFPGVAYVLLHSLSHALMTEISLECGYPASSLKERVYALEAEPDRPARYGILIYTAATGVQGTLGGLVDNATRLSAILERAIERLTICSNDPVCADHEPGSAVDERALHGAACHGCLLIAETSCERRNQFLDRSLLVETMTGVGSALFGVGDPVQSAAP